MPRHTRRRRPRSRRRPRRATATPARRPATSTSAVRTTSASTMSLASCACPVTLERRRQRRLVGPSPGGAPVAVLMLANRYGRASSVGPLPRRKRRQQAGEHLGGEVVGIGVVGAQRPCEAAGGGGMTFVQVPERVDVTVVSDPRQQDPSSSRSIPLPSITLPLIAPRTAALCLEPINPHAHRIVGTRSTFPAHANGWPSAGPQPFRAGFPGSRSVRGRSGSVRGRSGDTHVTTNR